MKKIDGDTFKLDSTGVKISANNCILGLVEEEGIFRMYDGYDSFQGDSEDYTPEERKEIAEYMIDLWKHFGGLQ